MVRWTALSCSAAALTAVSALAQDTSGSAQPEYRVIGAGVTGASRLTAAAGRFDSKLAFESSDRGLNHAFAWAKGQASAYAHEGDPVGPWYEGGEPGRESFCMRDISHQTMGAHALGLARHTHNMLRRFAENISDSKDWCSYWGMTRQNRPRRVDYKSETEFWYCLPANFDVVDACYRMYLWSGDTSYAEDPVFLNFYDRTVVDYVDRWGLSLDYVMRRPRLMNVRGVFDPESKFQPNRGIPGYDEQTKDYLLGVDVLATQYLAYKAYAHFQELRGDAARAGAYRKKAAEVRALVNTAFWNEAGQHFYARLDKDRKPDGRAGSGLLYRGIVDDGARMKAALGEGGRGSAEVLYRFGDPDAAYQRMLDVALGPGVRREYPETSYAWLAALVNGAMGITLEAPSPLQAWVQGYWVETLVRTVPGLGSKVAWAELRNLPIRASEVTVRHEGVRKTVVTNQRGPAFMWQAVFAGSHESLLINGRPMKAESETGPLGRVYSWVRVTVGAGGAVSVEVPGEAAQRPRS